jgi:hypothetical protein
MGEAARRNPKDFKIEILLAIVGLGATAGGFALPLIYPHFPWWIPATILFVGTALFINRYRRNSDFISTVLKVARKNCWGRLICRRIRVDDLL